MSSLKMSLKNGIGRRVTLMISDWLVLNSNELTWIALIGGSVLLVGFSMM
ncbi:hypothetical protein [Rhodospirillaceae bacterium SYSU D60014]